MSSARCTKAQTRRQAGADRLPHHHRLRPADARRARRRRTAMRRAPRRSPARARSWTGPTPPFVMPDDHARPLARHRRARARRRTTPGRRARPRRRKAPGIRRRHRRARFRPSLAPALIALKEKTERGEARRRHPQDVGKGAGRRSTANCPITIGGSADLTPSNNTKTKDMIDIDARRFLRPLHPLRHPRAWHGGGDERHGAAWRRHSLWRHLPGVLRLLPPVDPPRRADGHPRRSS